MHRVGRHQFPGHHRRCDLIAVGILGRDLSLLLEPHLAVALGVLGWQHHRQLFAAFCLHRVFGRGRQLRRARDRTPVLAALAALSAKLLELRAGGRASALPSSHLVEAVLQVEVRVLAGNLDDRLGHVGAVLGQPQRSPPQGFLHRATGRIGQSTRRHQRTDLRAPLGHRVNQHVVGVQHRVSDARQPLARLACRLGHGRCLAEPRLEHREQRVRLVVLAVSLAFDNLPRCLLLVVRAYRAQHHRRIVDLGGVDLDVVLSQRHAQRRGCLDPVVALDNLRQRPVAVNAPTRRDHHRHRHPDGRQRRLHGHPAFTLGCVRLVLPNVQIECQRLEPCGLFLLALPLGLAVHHDFVVRKRTHTKVDRCCWLGIPLGDGCHSGVKVSERPPIPEDPAWILAGRVRLVCANDQRVALGKDA